MEMAKQNKQFQVSVMQIHEYQYQCGSVKALTKTDVQRNELLLTVKGKNTITELKEIKRAAKIN